MSKKRGYNEGGGGMMFELPATFEMVVWFTDGEMTVKATLSLPVGQYPSHKSIEAMVKKAEEELAEMGMRLCGPHEFGRAYVFEETGQRLVFPGRDEWAAPYSVE